MKITVNDRAYEWQKTASLLSGFRVTLYLHEKIENQTAVQDKEVWVLNSYYYRDLQSSYLVDLWLLKLQIAWSLQLVDGRFLVDCTVIAICPSAMCLLRIVERSTYFLRRAAAPFLLL